MPPAGLLPTARDFEGTKRKETKKRKLLSPSCCRRDGRDRAGDGGRSGLAELSAPPSIPPNVRKSPRIPRSILQPPARSCAPLSQLHADQRGKEKPPCSPCPHALRTTPPPPHPPLNSHPVPLPPTPPLRSVPTRKATAGALAAAGCEPRRQKSRGFRGKLEKIGGVGWGTALLSACWDPGGPPPCQTPNPPHDKRGAKTSACCKPLEQSDDFQTAAAKNSLQNIYIKIYIFIYVYRHIVRRIYLSSINPRAFGARRGWITPPRCFYNLIRASAQAAPRLRRSGV